MFSLPKFAAWVCPEESGKAQLRLRTWDALEVSCSLGAISCVLACIVLRLTERATGSSVRLALVSVLLLVPKLSPLRRGGEVYDSSM
eukprot:4794242-Amphidinium_carterae.2